MTKREALSTAFRKVNTQAEPADVVDVQEQEPRDRREERPLPRRDQARLRGHPPGVRLQDREPECNEHVRLWRLLWCIANAFGA